MAEILTVTLNPALDVNTAVGQLETERKLRCEAPQYDPGGGGINVSRAIKELGGESTAFVVLAGATGQHLKSLLDRGGIDCAVWQGQGETRTSLQVAERVTGRRYRFVLPGPEWSAADQAAVTAALERQLELQRPRFVVLSGSLPPGLPVDFYADLTERARQRGAKVILDTSGPALEAALGAKPFLVKPDRFEAQALLKGRMPDVSSASDLARSLLAEGAAEAVILTLGDEGALVATAETAVHIHPPRMEVASAVGAGDSYVAALTLGLARGWSLVDAGRFGVAAAAAAVTTEATELCKRATTEAILEAILAEEQRTAAGSRSSGSATGGSR